MNGKQRRQNRETAAKLHRQVMKPWKCDGCGRMTKETHFFPPCLGEPGFYFCDQAESLERSKQQ